MVLIIMKRVIVNVILYAAGQHLLPVPFNLFCATGCIFSLFEYSNRSRGRRLNLNKNIARVEVTAADCSRDGTRDSYRFATTKSRKRRVEPRP
ncbi:hypothetical protein PUN28_012625 [Cardiocondyla obscurior]|uniref:Secreted protein n=1 Tax=Cardiocondyla obscurior TaxID=286306 RepID=A0AAW2FHR4_9HYME